MRDAVDRFRAIFHRDRRSEIGEARIEKLADAHRLDVTATNEHARGGDAERELGGERVDLGGGARREREHAGMGTMSRARGLAKRQRSSGALCGVEST